MMSPMSAVPALVVRVTHFKEPEQRPCVYGCHVPGLKIIWHHAVLAPVKRYVQLIDADLHIMPICKVCVPIIANIRWLSATCDRPSAAAAATDPHCGVVQWSVV